MSYEKSTTASRREERRDNTSYLHVSCTAEMIDDPRTLKDGILRPQVPWVSGGETFYRHKNKRKEMNRALARRKA